MQATSGCFKHFKRKNFQNSLGRFFLRSQYLRYVGKKCSLNMAPAEIGSGSSGRSSKGQCEPQQTIPQFAVEKTEAK